MNSSIPFSSTTFKNSSDRELMSSDLYHNHNHHHHHHPNHQQQQQQSSGLVSYRSAPSSFFSSILDGTDYGGGGGGGGGGVDGCEEYLNPHTSSPETETIFSRFVSGNGSGESEDSPDLLQYQTAMKHDMNASSPLVYSSAASRDSDLTNQNSVSMEGSFRVMNSMAMENLNQVRTSSGNCSNLIRQSSSPAGFLANLNVENGFTVTREGGNLRTSNRANVEASLSTSRLNNHMKSSSGPSTCSRFNPQIAGNGNGVGRGSPENGLLGNTNDTNRCYLPSIPNDSWNESTFTSLKRNTDGDLKMFSSLNGLDTENGDSRHYTAGLTHHLSLPKTTAEMAAVEKYLQFQQDAVPCKIRAKRGFATHPRSIAERVRRTRISERMRKLQELFPNMDKQANTADMLDLAVEYIKDLQKEVQTLTDIRSRCTCSSKQKQSSPNV